MPPRKNDPLSATERMRIFRERKAAAGEGRLEVYLPASALEAEAYIKSKRGPERVAQLVQWVLETEAGKIRKEKPS